MFQCKMFKTGGKRFKKIRNIFILIFLKQFSIISETYAGYTEYIK